LRVEMGSEQGGEAIEPNKKDRLMRKRPTIRRLFLCSEPIWKSWLGVPPLGGVVPEPPKGGTLKPKRNLDSAFPSPQVGIVPHITYGHR
jgi:hypothetical protein